MQISYIHFSIQLHNLRGLIRCERAGPPRFSLLIDHYEISDISLLEQKIYDFIFLLCVDLLIHFHLENTCLDIVDGDLLILS